MLKKNPLLIIVAIFAVAITFELFYTKSFFLLTDTSVGVDNSSNNLVVESNSNIVEESSPKKGFSKGEITIIFIVAGLFVCCVIANIGKIVKPGEETVKLDKKKAISEEEFKTYFRKTNMQDFMFERLSDLMQIHFHWMNFSYPSLKEKLSEGLYNQYVMELNTLASSNEKNVMKDFNTIDYMITRVNSVNGVEEVTMEVIMSYIDYIERDGKCVIGNPNEPVTKHFELVFKSVSNVSVDKCPRCGAPVEDKNAKKCSYCRLEFRKNNKKWVLSKKIAKDLK